METPEQILTNKMVARSNAELCDLAKKELRSLCAAPSSFTMSVPVRDTDTDMIISELIRRVESIPSRLTDDQIDAMFPYPINMEGRVRQLEYRNVARQVRDLLQGKGGEGV